MSFSKVQSAAKKELFGAQVERIDPLELVTDAKGVVSGANLRIDFETGDVWARVGCLDTVGEAETLPASGNMPAKVVDKLGVVEDGATFMVDAAATPNEKMHGIFSIWRAPKGFLVQLVRHSGVAAKAAPAARTAVLKR
jgi:hypothetical protein